MTEHKIDFSGTSIGNVNIDSTVQGNQIGTQHNYADKSELTQAAKEIQDVLIHLQKDKSTDIQTAVQKEIQINATFYERIYFMLQAGSIETLKALFPPLGIPIEMIKAWVEAKPMESPKILPPGGF